MHRPYVDEAVDRVRRLAGPLDMRLGLFPVDVVIRQARVDNVEEGDQDLVAVPRSRRCRRVAKFFQGGGGLSDRVNARLVNGEPERGLLQQAHPEPSGVGAYLRQKGPLRWRGVVPLKPVGPANHIEYGGRIGHVVSEGTRDGGSFPMRSPSSATRPRLTLSPTSPQHDAGIADGARPHLARAR